MKRLIGILFFVFLFLVVFLSQAVSLYTDWLWFQEVGFTQVFKTALAFKLTLAIVFGGLFFLLVYFNVKLAAKTPTGVRFSDEETAIELPSLELVDPLLKRLLLPVAILLGLFAAPQAASQWKSLLLFLNSVPFGL